MDWFSYAGTSDDLCFVQKLALLLLLVAWPEDVRSPWPV